MLPGAPVRSDADQLLPQALGGPGLFYDKLITPLAAGRLGAPGCVTEPALGWPWRRCLHEKKLKMHDSRESAAVAPRICNLVNMVWSR